MFPVGFVAELFVSTPILDNNGKFRSWYDGWVGDRAYAVDMAGFAVGIKFFMKVTKKVKNNFFLSFLILCIYLSVFRKQQKISKIINP